jgi:hypothetical protein
MAQADKKPNWVSVAESAELAELCLIIGWNPEAQYEWGSDIGWHN